MHELAIAQSILSTVQQEMSRHNLTEVDAIVIRLGELSDVVPEALKFNFDIIKESTTVQRTELVIERVPIKAKCRECEHEFIVENMIFSCSKCTSRTVDLLEGEELDIAYLEVPNNVPGQVPET